MSKYQQQKERARERAVNFQLNFCEFCYDWQDLAEWGEYFSKLGKKYGLIKEFRENGII